MAAIPPKTNIKTESKNEIAVDKYSTELPYARHIIMITMDWYTNKMGARLRLDYTYCITKH
jgi:hypothetical protein